MSDLGKFRKSFFGFNPKDVMEYIAWLKNDYYTYKQEKEKEIAGLYEKIEKLESQKYDNEEATVFDSEQAKLLKEMENGNEAAQNKIDKVAEKLEGLVEEIETLINKTE